MKNLTCIAFTATLLLSVALYAIADYYAVLGVDHHATAGQITTAFRKLSLQYHPDKNPNNKEAEAHYKQIVEARSVLIDPTRRAQYDATVEEDVVSDQPTAGLLTGPAIPTKKASTAEVLTGVGNVLFKGTLAWAQVLAARGDMQVRQSLETLKDSKRPARERAQAASYIEARFVNALTAMNPVLDELVTLAVMADPEKGQKMKDIVDTYKGYIYYMSIGNEAQREYLALMPPN